MTTVAGGRWTSAPTPEDRSGMRPRLAAVAVMSTGLSRPCATSDPCRIILDLTKERAD